MCVASADSCADKRALPSATLPQHSATPCNTLQHALRQILVQTIGRHPATFLLQRCFTLYYTATRCNMLQHTHTSADFGTEKKTLPSTTSCNTLQQAATRCNTATRCNKLQHAAAHTLTDFVEDLRASPSALFTAPRCNPLQHAATRFNTLQRRYNTHLDGFRGRQKCIAQRLFPTVIVSLGAVGVFLGVFRRTAAFAACVTFFVPRITVSVSVVLPVARQEVKGGRRGVRV